MLTSWVIMPFKGTPQTAIKIRSRAPRRRFAVVRQQVSRRRMGRFFAARDPERGKVLYEGNHQRGISKAEGDWNAAGVLYATANIRTTMEFVFTPSNAPRSI